MRCIDQCCGLDWVIYFCDVQLINAGVCGVLISAVALIGGYISVTFN